MTIADLRHDLSILSLKKSQERYADIIFGPNICHNTYIESIKLVRRGDVDRNCSEDLADELILQIN